jgi:glutamate-ammonia-ligase adenylyltransferase
LANAAQYPQLTLNSGNLALLETAAKLGLIEAAQSEVLRTLYRELRSLQHQMRLNNQTPCRIQRDRLDVQPVLALWQKLLVE